MACNFPMYRIPYDDAPGYYDFLFRSLPDWQRLKRRVRNGGIFLSRLDYSYINTFLEAHKSLYHLNGGNSFNIIQTVPCGQCIECRIDTSREWANRCVAESLMHDDNCFLTLTYDDPHLNAQHYWKPFLDFDSKGNYKLCLRPELSTKDLELFIKNFRSHLDYHYGKKVKFFGAGEYGEASLRPHFHVLIFGWQPDDKELFLERKGNNYYKSDFLSSVWDKGNIVAGDLNWSTCAYTARYVTKKITGKEREFREKAFSANVEQLLPQLAEACTKLGYDFDISEQREKIKSEHEKYIARLSPKDAKLFDKHRLDAAYRFRSSDNPEISKRCKSIIEKHSLLRSLDYMPGTEEKCLPIFTFQDEFVRMSTRPAIGKEYYEEHKNQIYQTDELIVPRSYGEVLSSSPPRYFDKLYDLEQPEELSQIKADRIRKGNLRTKSELLQTGLDEFTNAERKNRIHKNKLKRLIRPLE